MARHLWTVLCSKGILDGHNSLTIIDVVERIDIGAQLVRHAGSQSERDPPLPKRALIKFDLQLISLWMRSALNTPELIDSQVRIVAPNGEVIGGASTPVNLSEAQRFRTTITLGVLPLIDGVIEFEVYSRDPGATEWQRVAQIPLELRIERLPDAGVLAQGSPKKETPRKASPRKKKA